MKIRRLLGFTLVLLFSAGHTNAATTLTEWGSVASISNSICATNFCGDDADLFAFLSNLSVDPVDGGQNARSATVSTGAWPLAGSAQASGTVSGDLSVPLLTAGAASGTNQWIAGQTLVAQGYQYAGTGPETLQLQWGLTGTITNPDNDPLTGLIAAVAFLAVDRLTFSTVGDLSSALAVFASLKSTALDSAVVEAASGSGNLGDGTLSIEVASGDQIYLVMGLMAAAGGDGAKAESLSTLSASFVGDPALIQANTLVPLPPAAWLFGSSLIGLLGYARYRNRA